MPVPDYVKKTGNRGEPVFSNYQYKGSYLKNHLEESLCS